MSYLYAVQMTIYGYPFAPIKIGLSENPTVRAKAYNSGPFPTAWLGSWPNKNGSDGERQIHGQFAQFRLVGEWFYPAKPLVRFIEQKTGYPIGVMQYATPSKLRAGFQRRFVALFPDGASSVDAEWAEPGCAKPCGERAILSAQRRLDALEAADPVSVALKTVEAGIAARASEPMEYEF